MNTGEDQRFWRPRMCLDENMEGSFSESEPIRFKAVVSSHWDTAPDLIHILLCSTNINCGGFLCSHGKITSPCHVSVGEGSPSVNTRRNINCINPDLLLTRCSILFFRNPLSFLKLVTRGTKESHWMASFSRLDDKVTVRWAEIFVKNNNLLSFDLLFDI